MMGRLSMGRGRHRRGQAIFETILLIAAVIAVLVVAVNTVIKKSLNKSLNDSTGAIENSSGRLTNALMTPGKP